MTRLTLITTLLGACVFSAPAVAANPPANICVELTAWIDQATKADGGKSADAANTPASQAPAVPKLTTAVEPATGSKTTPAPAGQDQPQNTSGLSGPVRNEGPGASGPQGAAQESAKSSEANPKPKPTAQATAVTAATSEPKAPLASPQALQKVRQSAGANDLDACAAVAREMRLAGVALPNPIIALAALKPELRNTAPQGPAPGVPPTPMSGVTSAPAALGQSAPQQSDPPAR